MLAAEKATYRTVAIQATKLYPGALGELVARELLAFEEFGYRLPGETLISRLRDQVMQAWAEHEVATWS